MSDLPPCGIFRTTRPIGEAIPAGRLVYFHNHGDPGPGVYLPQEWKLNRAQWQPRGTTIPDPAWAATLQPLAPEGLYRVREAFTCCEKNCRTFEPELLVQLGYNGTGDAIVFVPEWNPTGLAIPTTGTGIDEGKARHLAPLTVSEARGAEKPAGLMH